MGSLYCYFMNLLCTIHIELNSISPEVTHNVQNHHDRR